MDSFHHILLSKSMGIVYTRAMNRQSFKKKVVAYLHSPFYLVSVFLLSFLCFLVPTPFIYLPVSLLSLLSFLPLLQDNGIYYSGLVLSLLTSSSRPLRNRNLPAPLVISTCAVFLSRILFLFIHKPKRHVNALFYFLLILFLLILTSYCIKSIQTNENFRQCWFFIIFFFVEIVIYRRLCSTSNGKSGLRYLSQVSAAISTVFFFEILCTLFSKNHYAFFSSRNLSFASSEVRSCLIVFQIPFLAFGVYKKKWYLVFFALVDYISLILLGNYISFIFLLISFVPFVFLAFHSYEKLYPYLILVGLVAILAPFCVLLFLHRPFSTGVIDSRKHFHVLSSSNPNYPLLKRGWDRFKQDYIIGSSVLSITTREAIDYFPNAYLQIGVLSGIIGIFFYLLSDISLYVLCLKGKTKSERVFFFYFLILHEIRNWLRDATTDWRILLRLLTAVSVYQGSIYQDQRIIHDSFLKIPSLDNPVNPDVYDESRKIF